MLSLEDKFGIHELINKYGHIIDKRDFKELDQVFTERAEFNLSRFDEGKIYQGIDQIISLMEQSQEHPVAHHATNIVIDPSSTHELALVESKGLGVGQKGRVGSVVYRDSLTRLDGHWLISKRDVQLLRAPGQQLKA